MVVSWRQCPALAVAAPLWLSGCAATVYPPQRVAEPAQIGVLDHGRHSSLIVEIPGGMVRYSYGDWHWYALGRTGPAEGTSALLWPTQAALGRRELPGPFSPVAVSREVRVAIEHALYLTVDARAVRRLVDRLDGIYQEHSAALVYNQGYDLCSYPIRIRIRSPATPTAWSRTGSSSSDAGSKGRRCSPSGSWAPADPSAGRAR